MSFKCSHCGAPLQVAPDQTVVTCRYCQSVTRVGSEPRPKEARPRSASSSLIVGLAVAGVATSGAIAAFVSSRRTATPSPQAVATPSVVAVDALAPESDPLVPESKPAPDPLTTVTPPTPAPKARPKPAPVPTGPISTKKEAEEVLRPAVLACMKEHGTYYLITRLGNERRGGTVPSLGLTGTSVVDYKETPGFASTPLGRCVAKAAGGVRAPAYGGNYIYFGLRNESIPDPLADAPAGLVHDTAQQVLAALDDEARDCATRSPAGGRPGEEVSVMVFFEGATGKVSRIEPYYIELRSAYGRCLSAVYRRANVGKFRAIEDKVVHHLKP